MEGESPTLRIIYATNLVLVRHYFYKNYMKLNAGKCHFMYYGKNTESETFLSDKSLMANDNEKKSRSYNRQQVQL